MNVITPGASAAIEAQLKAAANGDIPIEEALAAANLMASTARPVRGHPWIHPTKGWREHARATGTNRRRKLRPEKMAEAMELRPVRVSEAMVLDIETRADI